MAGGVWDYVAANLTKSDETQIDGKNPTTPSENTVKYPNMNSTDLQPWRAYFYNNDYCQWNSCGGQALHETKNYQSVNNWTRSWGSDASYLSNLTDPWLRRGGRVANTSAAGLFASDNVNGWSGVYSGSRAALAGY